jgi:hypothetical protein
MTSTVRCVGRAAAIVAVASLLIAVQSEATAEQITFSRITANSSTVIPLGQLFADVVNTSSSQVSFVFHNNVGVPSSITGIFVDNTASVLDSLLSVTNSDVTDADLDFVAGNSSPATLPSANTASPPFVGTAALGAGATAGPGGVVEHGIDESGDTVQLVYSLQSGKQFSDVIADLSSGSLRFGLHVQSIGGAGGLSDSYVNQAVPEPSTLALLGLGAIGLFVSTGRGRKRTV